MKAKIHFTCDPDFYAMALSYEDRDRWEGDLHVMCGGECDPGVPCECWCHSPEGELIYGHQRRSRRVWREANSRAIEAREGKQEVLPRQAELDLPARWLKQAEGIQRELERYGSNLIESALHDRDRGWFDLEILVLNTGVEFYREQRPGLAAFQQRTGAWPGEEPGGGVVSAKLAELEERLAEATALAEESATASKLPGAETIP